MISVGSLPEEEKGAFTIVESVAFVDVVEVVGWIAVRGTNLLTTVHELLLITNTSSLKRQTTSQRSIR